jgi:hypothetical protein
MLDSRLWMDWIGLATVLLFCTYQLAAALEKCGNGDSKDLSRALCNLLSDR